jgi:hypothetical protein
MMTSREERNAVFMAIHLMNDSRLVHDYGAYLSTVWPIMLQLLHRPSSYKCRRAFKLINRVMDLIHPVRQDGLRVVQATIVEINADLRGKKLQKEFCVETANLLIQPIGKKELYFLDKKLLFAL